MALPLETIKEARKSVAQVSALAEYGYNFHNLTMEQVIITRRMMDNLTQILDWEENADQYYR